MKKSFFSLIAVIFIAAALVGCELNDTSSSEKYPINSMTELEYKNAVNLKLMPILNNVQSFLGHHLDVIDGIFPVKEEIVLVDETLDSVQATIDEIDALYPPTQYAEHKLQTITSLNGVKDGLKRYRAALESGGAAQIKEAAAGLKVVFTTLKRKFGPIT
jgi:hypothetical protein